MMNCDCLLIRNDDETIRIMEGTTTGYWYLALAQQEVRPQHKYKYGVRSNKIMVLVWLLVASMVIGRRKDAGT
jgi:hypothetical protein